MMCIDAVQNSPTVKECMSRTGLPFVAEIGMCVEDIKVGRCCVAVVLLLLLYVI